MGGKPVFTVPAKTIVNFKSGFAHKLLCDGPTFSAGTACVYKCAFCYVPDMFAKQQPFLKKHGVVGKHEDVVVRRERPVEILRRQILAKPEDYRNQRLTIYASPAVDVAANMELVRETIELCGEILSLTKWDIRLLSKSNLLHKIAQGFEGHCIADDARRRIIYGVSTGTLNNELARSFEEGTPNVTARLKSLHWLQDNGFRTYGMLCPSLPLPDGQYDVMAFAMALAIRAEKCEHVWAEVINVRGDSMTRTVDRLRQGDFHAYANELQLVSTDKYQWEAYARLTFLAHAEVYNKMGSGKLRFLQYVNNSNRQWWADRVDQGAILL